MLRAATTIQISSIKTARRTRQILTTYQNLQHLTWQTDLRSAGLTEQQRRWVHILRQREQQQQSQGGRRRRRRRRRRGADAEPNPGPADIDRNRSVTMSVLGEDLKEEHYEALGRWIQQECS